MICIKFIDTVNNVLKERQCCSRKGSDRVEQTITLRLIIEKPLKYQITSVLSFVDYEKAFDLAD